MTKRGKPELLLLHALPLDGSMWSAQMELLPGRTYAPTLYPLGDRIETWAAEVLRLVKGDRLIKIDQQIQDGILKKNVVEVGHIIIAPSFLIFF